MDVDVFISYARPDRERIEALATVLASEGYAVWWDHDISGGAAFAADNAVAVLPLDNFSEGEGQQFFVDGIHEALITELSKIRALKVISRTSSRVYTNSGKPLLEIAAELGVSRLIEGSVARFGDQVRIGIQLIDARADTTLWAESYL